MPELLDGLQIIGDWSVPSLWLPLLAWTLLALPAYAALRLFAAPPELRYRLLQALLAALPLGVLATTATDLFGVDLWMGSLSAARGTSDLIILPQSIATTGTEEATASATWTVYQGLGLLTIAAGGLALVRVARLAQSARALARLRARPLPADHEVQALTRRMARAMGIQRTVAVSCTPDAPTPITYGVMQPTILLPASLRERNEALQLALTHELVHIRRHDFLARWCEQLTAALFAIHPGVWVLTRAIERTREIACDAEALQVARCSPKAYANLLYSFSTPFTRRPAFALSIAETSSTLKERIQAMTNLQPMSSRLTRFTPALAIGFVFMLAASIVACSDSITPPEQGAAPSATTQSTAPDTDKEVFVVVEERPQLKGGMEALANAIRYPESAKKAGIEGRVFVQFIVNEQGTVQNVKVTRSVNEALDAEAVRAVKAMSFEPGKQRGEPVKVQMSLPVTFKLGGTSATEPSSSGQSSTLDNAHRQTLPIHIASDGTITIQGRTVPMEDLQSTVQTILDRTDQQIVVSLNVENSAPTARIKEVQEQLRATQSTQHQSSSPSGRRSDAGSNPPPPPTMSTSAESPPSTARQPNTPPPPPVETSSSTSSLQQLSRTGESLSTAVKSSPASTRLQESGLVKYIQHVEVDKSGPTPSIAVTLKADAPTSVKSQLRNKLQPALDQNIELIIR